MIKITKSYTDYNGNERTEDFWFNLTKAECLEMNLSTEGGLDAYLQKIVDTKDVPKLIKQFKDLVILAYGEKSADGRRFMKNDEIRTAFKETEAYSEIFMELATDAEAATRFINGIVPQDLVADHKQPESK